jgi:hypothetical protein
MKNRELTTCEHHVCRCVRAEELARMYDRTGDGRLLREAIDVHERRVSCRLPARCEPRAVRP